MLAVRKKLYSTPIEASVIAAELANIRENDVVYDIGCGDGRVLIYLAQNTLCRKFVGVEIDVERSKVAQENVTNAGLDTIIQIKCENALNVEYDEATVVFLYLIPRGLRIIKPILIQAIAKKKQQNEMIDMDRTVLRDVKLPLLRVVTYMSGFDNEHYVRKEFVHVQHQEGSRWPIFLYHFM